MPISDFLEKAVFETAKKMCTEGIAGDVQVDGAPEGFFVTRESPFVRSREGEAIFPLAKFTCEGELYYVFQALRPKA